MLSSLGPRTAAQLLALSILAAVLPVAGSCTRILGLEDFEDTTEALCAELDRCYGTSGLKDCRAHVRGRLAASPTEAVAKWLEYFGDSHCLVSCESALRCLDEPPICAGGGADCRVEQQCCGFSGGLGSCDADRKECCAPRGV